MSFLPAVSEATTSGPVQLEEAVGVRHRSAVQRQSLSGGSGRGEVDEAVAGIAPTTNIRITYKTSSEITVYSPRELVADHLNIDLLAHLEPEVADEVLVDPGLKLTHPEVYCQIHCSKPRSKGGEGLRLTDITYQRVVLPS